MHSDFRKTRIACYTGYVTQAITVNLAPLLFVTFQTKFDVSLGYIASLTLITFLIQIAIDALAVKFVEKVSYRVLAVTSQLCSLLGLVMLSFAPYVMLPQIGILISVLVYSSGSGLSEVVLSPLIEALPQDTSSGGNAMTLMHSFYSWGQAGVILISTLLLRIVGGGAWYVLPLFWALIPLCNTIAFTRVPLADMTVHEEGHSVSGMLRQPVFVVAFILMICAGASEQAMAQWASMFAEKGLGVTKVLGDILGPCMFAVMMGIGRTAHGLWGKKLSLSKLLLALSAFTLACYALCVFVPVPMVSLIACGAAGLGVSIMWPGMLTLCSNKFPLAGASMFAMLALGGDVGCSLGPYLAGVASDTVCDVASDVPWVAAFADSLSMNAEQLGLRAGFLAAAVFPALMLCGVAVLCKKGFENKKEL